MKKTLVPFFMILAPALLLANGSPINTGEIQGTGNIQMIQKKNIHLLAETLSVRISGDYAFVRVSYRFQNLGPADKVTYGFPVEIAPYTGEVYAPKEEALTDFRIADQNDPFRPERDLPILETKIEKAGQEEEYKPFKKWHIVEIHFAEKEQKNVLVSYRVKSSLTDYVYSKSFRPTFSSRTFRYSLNPAQNWGEGIIQNCRIEIETGEFSKFDATATKISPRGYTIKDGVISWVYENLDLSTAEDIEFVYDNSSAEFTRYVNKERLPSKSIGVYTASSVLKKDAVNQYSYGPDNLFDDNLSTAWVEGVSGSGVGEWVEIEFTEFKHLEAIGIVNGYTKNESLYRANNRIRKIRLEITTLLNRTGTPNPETTEIELEEKQFNELNRNAQAPFISWLADFGDGISIKKIRLTILAVTAGDKYNDTCMAELYILGYR